MVHNRLQHNRFGDPFGKSSEAALAGAKSNEQMQPKKKLSDENKELNRQLQVASTVNQHCPHLEVVVEGWVLSGNTKDKLGAVTSRAKEGKDPNFISKKEESLKKKSKIGGEEKINNDQEAEHANIMRLGTWVSTIPHLLPQLAFNGIIYIFTGENFSGANVLKLGRIFFGNTHCPHLRSSTKQ
ncbi:unnamed protein product [Lactuca saligna]|uniref:Uncharacterized protein n=1 Tax=Lactuca saligna TaxID=75948 RepID=A0AA35V0M7_LACSI|nr:unnamed protein product [Lactuca saligna]